MNRRLSLLTVLIGFCFVLTARATVTPCSLVANGAVLQQGMEVPIWGTAKNGEKVIVKFQDQEVSTIAQDSHWLVKLKPLKPGGPYTMTITGENTLEITDLLVGEVWICAGQSNMQFGLLGSENGTQHWYNATDPNIRLFTVPRTGPGQTKRAIDNQWYHCNSNSVPYFSAVGYFFGRDLRRARQVPVGLISANVGGSIAERWASHESLEADPALRPIIEHPAPNEKPEVAAASLYNSMIVPLQPFAIRGVIWYQGESNAPRPEQYRILFPALIQGWRKAWGQGDFPFLFVQLPGGFEPEIREAQLQTWRNTPNTAMAVITDCTDSTVLHPRQKEPVGIRLALAARALVYGEKIESSGPVFERMDLDNSRIRLHFQHTGAGLVTTNGDLKGFTIAGAEGKFVKADAKIEGDTVMVSNPQISQPAAVRYNWARIPDGNLFNRDGLPASPFRTDFPAK